MRKIKKFAVFAVAIFIVLLNSVVAFAGSSGVNDGIKAKMVTDKEEYSIGEQVKVTIIIENTNSEAVKNVRYIVKLPKELKALEDTVLEKTFEILEAGQKEEISINAIVIESSNDTNSANDNNDNNDINDIQGGEVNTGDNSNVMAFCILAVLAVLAVVVMLLTHNKSKIFKNTIASVLMLSIPMLGLYSADAATVSKGFTIDKHIKYGDNNMEIVANIFYDYDENEKTVAYGEKNGFIVINAADAIENTSYALSDSDTTKYTGKDEVKFAWEITEEFEDPYTNTKHQGIQLTPDRDSNDSATDDYVWKNENDIGDAPSLSYKVYVQEEGDYYLCFHSNNPNVNADSFHVGVNGEYNYITTNAMTGGSNSSHAAVGTAWFYCDKEALHLNAGVNTITIWAQESGIILRQIMLTKEKPMEAKYMYFKSQKNAEWLEESNLVNGFIFINDLEDVDIAYNGQLDIAVNASASNGEKVELSVSSSTDNVKVSEFTDDKFTITAQRSGYSTISVTAKADDCTTVVKTFFVNVAYMQSGEAVDGAVQNLRVVPASETSNSIAILWDKPKDYTEDVEYDVYLDGSKVATRAHNKTHYTATNLKAATEYEFYVEAVYGDGTKSGSYKLFCCTDSQGEVIDISKAPYSAVGDGITMNTEAIQKAIDDCPKGGIVLIPEDGIFLTGALDLKSHMTLQVEGELLGSDNPNDYMYPNYAWDDDGIGERVLSRFEGWELMCLRSLLNAGYLNWQDRYEVTCEDLTICGNGKITGGGEKLQTASINMAQANGWAVGTTNQYLRSRGFLLNITQSKNVYLTGVHISDSPCWTVHMIYSDTVSTHGVEITSTIINGDGWDPDSSRNCMLFDSKISTGDDCVAIKSGKNLEGNKVAIPTENILIFDLVCDGGHGLAIGSEISGGVDNVTVRDVVVKNTLYGFQLKGTAQRGGGITNIFVQDSSFNQLLIKSNVPYNADGGAASDVPLFNNLTFKNILVDGTDMSGNSLDGLYNNGAIELSGFDKTSCHNHYVNNVLFENVILGSENNPMARIVMENCDGVTFKNVKQYNGTNPDYLLISKNKNIKVDDEIIPTFTDSIEAEWMGSFSDEPGTGYAHKKDNTASEEFYREIRSGEMGILKAQYNGEDGFAKVNVDYYDGGSANYKLYINDTLVNEWTGELDNGAKRSASTDNIVLKKGDIIKIIGTVNGNDKAAVDKVNVTIVETASLMISGVEKDNNGVIKSLNILSRDSIGDANVIVNVYEKNASKETVLRTVQEKFPVAGNNVTVTLKEDITVAAGEYYIIYVQDEDGNYICTPYIMPEYISTEIVVENGGVIVTPSENTEYPIGVKLGTTVQQLLDKISPKLDCMQTYELYNTKDDAFNNMNALKDSDVLLNGSYLKVIAEDGETIALYCIESKLTVSIIQLALDTTEVTLGTKVAVPKANINLIGYTYAAEGSTATYNVENWQGNIYFQAPGAKVGDSFEFKADTINIAADGYYTAELYYKRNTNRGTFDVQLVAEDGTAYTIGIINESGSDSMTTQKLMGDYAFIPAGNYTLRFECVGAGTLTVSELHLTAVAPKNQNDDTDTETKLIGEFNFDGTLSEDGKIYTENGIEFSVTNAEIVTDPTNANNNILSLDALTTSGTGTAYIVAEGGIVGDLKNGLTISVDLMTTRNQSNDSNAVISFGFYNESDVIDEVAGTTNGRLFLSTFSAYRIDTTDSYGEHQKILYPHKDNDGSSVWKDGEWTAASKDYLNTFQNQWTNITYVFTKDSISIYTNGVLSCKKENVDLSELLPYLNYNNTGKLSIGRSLNAGNKYHGYVDNLKIYSGALSDEEVKTIVIGN